MLHSGIYRWFTKNSSLVSSLEFTKGSWPEMPLAALLQALAKNHSTTASAVAGGSGSSSHSKRPDEAPLQLAAAAAAATTASGTQPLLAPQLIIRVPTNARWDGRIVVSLEEQSHLTSLELHFSKVAQSASYALQTLYGLCELLMDLEEDAEPEMPQEWGNSMAGCTQCLTALTRLDLGTLVVQPSMPGPVQKLPKSLLQLSFNTYDSYMRGRPSLAQSVPALTSLHVNRVYVDDSLPRTLVSLTTTDFALPLSALAKTLELPNLREVSVNIKHVFAAECVSQLIKCTQLEVVKLAYKQTDHLEVFGDECFYSVPEIDADDYVSGFMSKVVDLKPLRKLSLNSTLLNSADVARLSGLTNLTSLKLADVLLAGPGGYTLMELGEQLQKLPKLHSLDLKT